MYYKKLNKNGAFEPTRQLIMLSISSVIVLSMIIMILLFLTHAFSSQFERTPTSARAQIAIQGIMNCFGSQVWDNQTFTEQQLDTCYGVDSDERTMFGIHLKVVWKDGFIEHSREIASKNLRGYDGTTRSFPVTYSINEQLYPARVYITLEDYT